MEKLGLDQTIEILSKVSLFREVKDNQSGLRLIAERMELRAYQPKDVLTKQGEAGDEFYVLVKGTASVYKKTPEGDPYKVFVLEDKKSPAFGEGGLINEEARSATITCDTNVVCLILTREKFNEICSSNPEVALPILKEVAHALMHRLHQTTNDLMLLHKALMNEIRSN